MKASPLKRKVGLRAKAPMKRGNALQKANRKAAGKSRTEPHVTRARVWCKKIGYCQRCGKRKYGKNLDCHHILTVGAYPELKACPWNLLCLCRACHSWAHDSLGEFREWLESIKPGLLGHLYWLAREWVRKPVDEITALYDSLPPRAEFWASLEVGS